MRTFFLEHLHTPTGPLMIVTDGDQTLRAVEWADLDHRLRKLLRRHYGAGAIDWRDRPGPSAALQALRAYFQGDACGLADLPTATNGTAFQRQVWAALRRIPAGRTTSYGALAAEIGRPQAVRAVGLANAANPIPIVVPCHRVIGASGALTGYAGGLERKRWLLGHERDVLARSGAATRGGQRLLPLPAVETP
jgi:methylated-DNA-[protein]-cysteine S-methyltransferase